MSNHLNAKNSFTFDDVQLLSCVRLFATPWTAARQASLSFTVSRSLLKLMSIEPVMSSNHLIFCFPFSRPQSFSASRYFLMSQCFISMYNINIYMFKICNMQQPWRTMEYFDLLFMIYFTLKHLARTAYIVNVQ